MKQIWHKLSNIGLTSVADPKELQSLIITNRIIALAIILLVVIGTVLGLNQWNIEPILVFSLSAFFLFLSWLMKGQYFNVARLTLCLALPVIVLGMSILSKKIPGEQVTDSEYFDYRYVLIAASLVPPLIFGFARIRWLTLSLLPFLISFLLFDPLHDLMNVGYYQIDHSITSYHLSQWVATIMFLVITSGVLVMRRTSDEVQSKNSILINELNEANNQLETQRKAIEEANVKINNQNAELNKANNRLANAVSVTSDKLQESNRELVKHNSELQQFSYTISHNLRGPVASILGLINILQTDDPVQVAALDHLRKSAKSLDATIRDLGMIIDIRNDIFKIRQRVELDNLLDEIILPFQKEIQQRGISIERNITSNKIFTVKPMLSSILYNLISNALKYNDPEKNSRIQISTRETNGEFTLEVRDNGLGIDMDTHRHDLFKLYKRFHTHTEGKGIGLYLVKLQVEALGSTINVESELNKFTSFTIGFPKAVGLDHQILLNEEYAEVYFDATKNMVGIYWKKQVSSAEFRFVFNRSQEFMKEYNAVHWFIDTRKRGQVKSEDQLWLLTKSLPDLFKLGLKRLAVVISGDLDAITRTFYERNMELFAKYDIEVFFTQSPSDAFDWYEKRKITNLN